MNKVILIGRLARDPELRYTPSNIPVCRLTIAVDRRFKSENQQQTADFINCVAWRQQAEFISKYFEKGKRIAITGSIQVSTYDDQEGKKRYNTEVVIDDVEFVESKKESSVGESTGGNMGGGFGNPVKDNTPPQQGGFFVLDEDDGDIPF